MSSRHGVVSKDNEGYRVAFERILPYDVKAVWDVITNPEKISIWFLEVEMEFAPGGKMTFTFPDKDRTVSSGKIIRIVPEKVFEYEWEGELAVWELFKEGESKCRLVFTYSRIAEKYGKSVPAGWHVMLDHLEAVLGGRKEPFPHIESEDKMDQEIMNYYRNVWNSQFSHS